MGDFPRARGQELLVLVGLPGSGKTTLRDRHLDGYEVLSKDNRPGADRQIRELRALLKAGKSVVVDNTNASREERAPLLAVARAEGVPARAVLIDTPEAEVRRRNAGRGAGKVPAVAINTIRKRLQPPATGEGFASVVRATPAGDDFAFWEAG